MSTINFDAWRTKRLNAKRHKWATGLERALELPIAKGDFLANDQTLALRSSFFPLVKK